MDIDSKPLWYPKEAGGFSIGLKKVQLKKIDYQNKTVICTYSVDDSINSNWTKDATLFRDAVAKTQTKGQNQIYQFEPCPELSKVNLVAQLQVQQDRAWKVENDTKKLRVVRLIDHSENKSSGAQSCTYSYDEPNQKPGGGRSVVMKKALEVTNCTFDKQNFCAICNY